MRGQRRVALGSYTVIAVRPAVFIASSTQGLDVAYALQQNLEDVIESTVWPQGVFQPGGVLLDDLVAIVSACDFGIFVFHPDDVGEMDGVRVSTVRDNVIFELGLFVGKLGRQRSFVVKPQRTSIRIPSDLAGLTMGTYDPARRDGNLVAAVGSAAHAIRRRIRELGVRTTEGLEGTSTARIKHWEVYDLTESQQATDYYAALSRTISNAETTIYRSGRGFAEISHDEEAHISALIDAERSALQRGVRVARIQTSRRASTLWSDRYAALMEEFPRHLQVWGDFSEPPLVNVAVVDPANQERAMVQLLFESHEFVITKDRFKAATAIFLYGRRDIAASIERQFVQRLNELERLYPSDVRRMGATFQYFAYGSNLSSRHMRKRCPSAELVGTAVLYGWRFAFNVDAPHLGGSTAGIVRSDTPDEHVWGVVWEVTAEDRDALDAAERGGYQPSEIEVKLSGDRESHEVFTYVPIASQPTQRAPVSTYLDAMVEGAEEHGLAELLNRLQATRPELDDRTC
jgi:hypothetical protein